jgi:hypothetical protein
MEGYLVFSGALQQPLLAFLFQLVDAAEFYTVTAQPASKEPSATDAANSSAVQQKD